MSRPERLDGKVALITGGARGIGAETARALAGRGVRLVLTDVDQAPLTELAAELGEDRVLAQVADVCDSPRWSPSQRRRWSGSAASQ